MAKDVLEFNKDDFKDVDFGVLDAELAKEDVLLLDRLTNKEINALTDSVDGIESTMNRRQKLINWVAFLGRLGLRVAGVPLPPSSV